MGNVLQIAVTMVTYLLFYLLLCEQGKIYLGLLCGFILLGHTSFSSFSPRICSNIETKSYKNPFILYAPRRFHDLYRSDILRFASHLPKVEDEPSDKNNSKSRVIGSESDNKGIKLISSIAAAVAVISLVYFCSQSIDLNAIIQKSLSKVTEMGPYGYVYFALVSKNIHLILLFIRSSILLFTISTSGLYYCGSFGNSCGCIDSFQRISVWPVTRDSNGAFLCNDCSQY